MKGLFEQVTSCMALCYKSRLTQLLVSGVIVSRSILLLTV